MTGQEPRDRTGVVDRFGDTWVRMDGTDSYGSWWPITDGPGWEEWGRNKVGSPRPWDQVAPNYGPFQPASPERTQRGIELVLAEIAR